MELYRCSGRRPMSVTAPDEAPRLRRHRGATGVRLEISTLADFSRHALAREHADNGRGVGSRNWSPRQIKESRRPCVLTLSSRRCEQLVPTGNVQQCVNQARKAIRVGDTAEGRLARRIGHPKSFPAELKKHFLPGLDFAFDFPFFHNCLVGHRFFHAMYFGGVLSSRVGARARRQCPKRGPAVVTGRRGKSKSSSAFTLRAFVRHGVASNSSQLETSSNASIKRVRRSGSVIPRRAVSLEGSGIPNCLRPS